MTNTTMALYGAGLFVLGAIAALGGERLIMGHDQRDGMETVAGLQDWRLTCQPRTTKNGGCLIQSGIVQRGTNNVIAELSVAPKDKSDVLTIIAPLGVRILDGVHFGLGSISKTVQFKTCLPMGCIATLPMDSGIATAMSQGQNGTLIIVAADGRSIPLNFSLRGYSDAIADRAADMSARN